MTLTEQALNVIADMTVRMCELRVDGQVAYDRDAAPRLFRALLEAHQAAGETDITAGRWSSVESLARYLKTDVEHVRDLLTRVSYTDAPATSPRRAGR